MSIISLLDLVIYSNTGTNDENINNFFYTTNNTTCTFREYND